MSYAKLAFLCLIFLAVAPNSGLAIWSADPTLNLAVGDGSGDQVVPHLAQDPDGFCYVGWYDNKSGNYDVALQYLAADGTEMWPHGGLMVSTQPQNSWVMDWDLMADNTGNALVAFADIRGGSSNIHLYKIAPDGTFLWGADGIDITSSSDDKGPPSLTETADGDIVVAWFNGTAAGVRTIHVQRLAPDGTLRYAPGGIPVTEAADAYPAGQRMVPSGPDGFLLAYVPNYSFMSNRQIKAQRFDAAGSPVWTDYLMVMDNGTVPMGHYFEMMTDGQGGAYFSWTLTVGVTFGVRAQHLDADGTEAYSHNGAILSSYPGYYQINPGMTMNAATGELTVFYIQMDTNQNQKGVFGQRVGTAGELLWGANGAQILPVDSTQEGFVRPLDTGDGVIGLCFQAPANTYGQDRVIGFKVSTAGHLVWDPAVVDASTAVGGKDDLIATMGSDGMARAFWADDRNGSYDIYGQNLNEDGTLGLLIIAVPDVPVGAVLDHNYPNPFNPSTRIDFHLADTQPISLRIFDTKGRLVRTLWDGSASRGDHHVTWNGLDQSGRQVASGIYLCRLDTQQGPFVRKMLMNK